MVKNMNFYAININTLINLNIFWTRPYDDNALFYNYV